ncbi:putative ribosomal protein L33 [Helianthus annuus]|nr:putative ribosomal protein L33 [Helianthus annuus]
MLFPCFGHLFIHHIPNKMGLKKKSVKLLTRLISLAKTGFFYVKRKNLRMKANKLEIKKI